MFWKLETAVSGQPSRLLGKGCAAKDRSMKFGTLYEMECRLHLAATRTLERARNLDGLTLNLPPLAILNGVHGTV